MRIKVRSWIFLLFGAQGVLQVIYWELIKGYPACFMCKGYRVVYVSILIAAIIYRKRASMFRLLLLFGLIVVETLWSVWDVIQKMGMFTQKCQTTAQIIEGKMVFVPCEAQLASWGNIPRSPVGLNALLSVVMLGYVMYVLWQLKLWRFKWFRWSLVMIGLFAQESVASSHKDAHTAIQQALNVQNNKAVEKDVQKLYEIAEKNAKHYEAQARQLGAPPAKAALAEAQTIIHRQDASNANKASCKGKCSSFQPMPDIDPSLQVCMSFSVPIQVWKELNEDLIHHQGVFVVKGLPNNSFQAFAGKVLEFRKQGITAPIRIDPKLFERLKVNQVPIFVVKKKDETHTVSGTVTIPYVLNVMHIKNEGK
ncbi:MAG: TrbC family F-type conjugative pilus assembly protein [Alphaproteobacteria bacterium]|nr:TrbC family F-type conjugative pilus assembly protein [Methylococcaceae bacterium]MDP3936116.1 TrbC family F-type conjugative pilus assembly protein [Alphaproteobacteria bacterium]